MVADLTAQERSKLTDFARLCHAVRHHPKAGEYILYNKFLHFICLSVLRPPKTASEIAEDERKAEIEAKLLAEQEAEESETKIEEPIEVFEEPIDTTPKDKFTGNFYLGNQTFEVKQALKSEFTNYRK